MQKAWSSRSKIDAPSSTPFTADVLDRSKFKCSLPEYMYKYTLDSKPAGGAEEIMDL